jgi:hypothetical protein
MRKSLHRRAVLFCAVAAAALQAVSCAPGSPTPKTALLPAVPEPSFPALSGQKTPGCDHVLAVLQSLQDYTNGKRTRAVSFEFKESEINEYLAYSLRVKPRPGIAGLAVRIHANNEITVLANIDFGAVRKWNEWLIPEVLRPVFSDPRPLRLDMAFQTADGYGAFKLKNVNGPGDIPIPTAVMEWVLQAIAVHQPEWYDTTQGITLPFHLQRIWTANQSLFGDMTPSPRPKTASAESF